MPDFGISPYYKCEQLHGFDSLRERYFDVPLAELGFIRLPESDEERFRDWRAYYREQVYARLQATGLPLYIVLVADNHYRDTPNHIDVTLGEGDYEYPENGFNSIPLASLVAQQNPTRLTEEAEQYGLYGLPAAAYLEEIMQRAAHDLLTHGRDFLNGTLAGFYQLRRKKNQAMRPFTYYWMDGIEAQLQSRLAEDARIKEALRQKYSSEDWINGINDKHPEAA